LLRSASVDTAKLVWIVIAPSLVPAAAGFSCPSLPRDPWTNAG